MKLCIPTVDDRGLDARVSGHFGSAPYFTLVELEGGKPEIVTQPSCHQQRHERHHVGSLTARGVDALACRGGGRGATRGPS